jgi:predicted enzyme related to lactoylglutathione lyase
MDHVVHFEIPADDVATSKAFYSTAFGWEMQTPEQMDYTLATTVPVDEKTYLPVEPGAINGGLVGRSGTLAHPVITIGVASIEDSLKKIEAAGGSVVAPRVAADFGAYAYFKDTEGNILGLWETANRRD